MHRLWCLVTIGVLAVAVSGVGAGPAVAAKGGNNDTAQLCQHGGWKAFGTYANQGDCVNDGAQGSPPFGAAGKAACDAVHGKFIPIGGEPRAWLCDWKLQNASQNDTLSEACDAESGTYHVAGPDDFLNMESECNARPR
jgi:hypothetical protein